MVQGINTGGPGVTRNTSQNQTTIAEETIQENQPSLEPGESFGRLAGWSAEVSTESYLFYKTGKAFVKGLPNTPATTSSTYSFSKLVTWFKDLPGTKFLTTYFSPAATGTAAPAVAAPTVAAPTVAAPAVAATGAAARNAAAIKIAGRALPIAGAVLATIDVGMDWYQFSKMDSASDIIKLTLEKNLSDYPTKQNDILEAQSLINKGLTNPDNELALRKHLMNIMNLDGKSADALIKAAKKQNEEISKKAWDAGINTTCTVVGAVIGACLGGPIGACIGAGLGNLAAKAINLLRSASSGGFGGFFKGFFS